MNEPKACTSHSEPVPAVQRVGHVRCRCKATFYGPYNAKIGTDQACVFFTSLAVLSPSMVCPSLPGFSRLPDVRRVSDLSDNQSLTELVCMRCPSGVLWCVPRDGTLRPMSSVPGRCHVELVVSNRSQWRRVAERVPPCPHNSGVPGCMQPDGHRAAQAGVSTRCVSDLVSSHGDLLYFSISAWTGLCRRVVVFL